MIASILESGPGQALRSAQASGGGARRGLTLIEILIVIAILLAIGGLVVVNLLPAKDQADIDLQQVQFDQIDGAMKKFRLDLGRYPSEDEGLAALMSSETLADEALIPRWRGPYLEDAVSKDKWNHDIVYHHPSVERGEGYYDLISAGPDGEMETEDDITNHDRRRDESGELESNDDFAPPPAGTGGGGRGGNGGG